MGTILGIGAAYLFLKIALPLIALGIIAYLAYRFANRETRHATFASSEPTARDYTEEHRFDLEDVHDINDQPPRT